MAHAILKFHLFGVSLYLHKRFNSR